MDQDRPLLLAIGVTAVGAVVVGSLFALGAFDEEAPPPADAEPQALEEELQAFEEEPRDPEKAGWDDRDFAAAEVADAIEERVGHGEHPREDTPLPSIWGPEELGASRCTQESGVFGRTVTEYDARGRVVRTRNWRLRGETEERWVPSSVMRWAYREDGTVERRKADRDLALEGRPWTLRSLTMIPRQEGDWLYRRWVYDGGEDERRYRFVDGRLVESSHVFDGEPGIVTECEHDAAGRPIGLVDAELGETLTWRYGDDGALTGLQRTFRGREAPFEELTRGPAGEWILEEQTYEGDCAEVIFWQCSAVAKAFEGRLPDGLLPP